MIEEIIVAGFGGQGVLLLGQVLAQAGMLEGKHVSWFPSYGPEMRGGTANCSVVISTGEIGSPVVSEPDTAIVMNLPSLTRFGPLVEPGGLLILNSSLINEPFRRDDIEVVNVPASEEAQALGNARVANMVVLGVYLAASDIIKPESVYRALPAVLPERHHDLLPLNEAAIQRGMELKVSHDQAMEGTHGSGFRTARGKG